MKEFKFQRWVCRSAALAVLAGCSPERPNLVEPDPVEVEIARAMAATAKANTAVAEVEKSLSGLRAVSDSTRDATRIESETLLIDWNGPIEPLVESVARLADHSFAISGVPPVNPVMVSMAGFSGTPADAIRAVDRAAFGFARITTDHNSRKIRLEYPD